MSSIFFSYVGPTVATAYERQLEETDIWDIHPEDKPETLYEQFVPLWQEECQNSAEPSLVKTLRKLMYWRFLTCLLIKILTTAGSFAGPVLLNFLLVWYG